MAKAISVDIYKNNRGDSSNYGISHYYDEILILCDDGFIDVDLDNPPANLCKIVERQLFGREANYIQPYRPAKGVGYMYGGTICYSSDARFKSDHPLCLHDRDENARENEILSR